MSLTVSVLLAFATGLAGQRATNPAPPRVRVPGPQQLAWVDRNGRVIDSIGEPLQVLSDVAISADGSSIAVRGQTDGNDDIWVYNAASERRTRVTNNPAVERHPAWSSAGGRLAYTSYRNGKADLFMRSPDGSGTEEAVLAGPRHHDAHTWSKDGRIVVLQERDLDATERLDLRFVEMNGDRTPRPLVEGDSAAAMPRLAPDGRHLAYMSNDSGRWEVYVTAFPEGDTVQVSTAGGAWPRWNGAGDELFYFVADRLVAVPVSMPDPRRGLEFGTPVTLFTAGHVAMNQAALGTLDPVYDVAPDGQRFVVVQQLSGATP